MTGREGVGGDSGPLPDIVYVLRRNGTDEELRYSLRSLRNLPHRRVWIVGDKPDWVRNVEHLPRAHTGRTRFESVVLHVQAACRVPDLSDEFVYMNDDFFVVRPVERVEPLHRGEITDLTARPPRRRSQWQQGIVDTALLLKSWGIAPAYHYELHVPMLFRKGLMAEALQRARRACSSPNLMQRSLYANLHQVGGRETQDVKVSNRSHLWPVDSPYASTSNRAFALGRAGDRVRHLFPDPSPYEEV